MKNEDVSRQRVRVAVLGASGYTGADLIRLASRHPLVEIVMLSAASRAGKSLGDVFPHLGGLDLPPLRRVEEMTWEGIDVVFCALPHRTSQDIIPEVLSEAPEIRVIDMSADFRFRDVALYEHWYGRAHGAVSLQDSAVYGLTEHYREAIRVARLVACPGCYPTAVLTALLPLVDQGLITLDDIVIDAKSGVSGAGRYPKLDVLFSEVGEGVSPYCVAGHRHAPEIEQELSRASECEVVVSFTPHLVPMSRGELVSCYVRLADRVSADALRAFLKDYYSGEPFVRVLPREVPLGTQHVRGSNLLLLAVAEDRIPGRARLFAVLDNLVKGSSGQALQNMNLMFGIEETCGLLQKPLFP